jgi:hypothetical protein
MPGERSREAVHKFVNYWIDQGKFERRASDVIRASVSVNYRFRDIEKQIIAEAFFYYESRKIELVSTGGWLDSDFVYTGFDPVHQTCVVTRDHSLRITGSGEKTGGRYTVEIRPS